MNEATVFPAWQAVVQYSANGPNPQKIIETSNFRTVIVGLLPGQQVPPHPAPASAYHFLAGTGSMTVNGEQFPVEAGTTIVMVDGDVRGIKADTQLAFLGSQAAEINS